MATQTTPTQAVAAPATHAQKIGQYVQLGGLGGFVVGAILSLHHYAIGVCFLAGAVAYYIGGKLRAA